MRLFQWNSPLERQASYINWPVHPRFSPTQLVQAGFTYTETENTVRCLTCDYTASVNSWIPPESPSEAHVRCSPDCSFVPGIKMCITFKTSWKNKNTLTDYHINTDIIVPVTDASPTDTFTDQSVQRLQYPQYENVLTRIQSYSNVLKQRSKLLAEAGYFFTGEADIVRCFCCGLGLAKWNHQDEPWVEHARHSFKCAFLINEKGVDYVNDQQTRWEKIYNPKHPTLEDKDSRLKTFAGIWRTDIEQTPEILVDAGFFYTVHRLYLKEKEEEKDLHKMKETNRQLKEKMKCIRCRTNDICILFVNCGHRQTCEECAVAMVFCPSCDTRIKKRLKTYLS